MKKKDKLAYLGDLSKFFANQQREIYGNAIKLLIPKLYWDLECDSVNFTKLFGKIVVHNHENVVDFRKGFSEIKTENIVGKNTDKSHIELLKDIIHFDRSILSGKKTKKRVRKKRITRVMKEYGDAMRLIAQMDKNLPSRPDKGILYFSISIKKQFINHG